HTESLYVEESALTGESVPVKKQSEALLRQDVAIGDRKNMGYMGTMAVRGSGTGIVVSTGMATEMGRIAHLIETAEGADTPLKRRLEQLGKVLIVVSLILTAMVVVTGIIHGHDVYQMFLAGVSLAVAAIPEGLPAIVTIALALGVQRMIKRQAIVRKLPSVETLGCATVICSDKTGTLTQNKM
ncbi:HAD-IC family P-type ATPase, partial [Thermoactinomyces intermedius]